MAKNVTTTRRYRCKKGIVGQQPCIEEGTEVREEPEAAAADEAGGRCAMSTLGVFLE